MLMAYTCGYSKITCLMKKSHVDQLIFRVATSRHLNRSLLAVSFVDNTRNKFGHVIEKNVIYSKRNIFFCS